MQTTYGQLKLTQKFTVPNTDEFSFRRLRGEYSLCNETGVHIRFGDDDTVNVLGAEPVLHDEPTETEKIACMLLSKEYGHHWGLQRWIKAILVDPDEMRNLSQFVLETPMEETPDITIAEGLRKEGFVSPTKLYDREHNIEMAIINYMPKGIDEKHSEYWWTVYVDRAVWTLTQAVIDYRQDGRPNGEQSDTIQMGTCSPISLTSSLAASIIEYHHFILNIAYTRYERLEDDFFDYKLNAIKENLK